MTIEVPEEQLADLRSRSNATKWPDREVDASPGVQLETIQALADYWGTDYDWRKFEERFAAHGLDVDEEGNGAVTESRCYQLIPESGGVSDRTFEASFLDASVHAYVFTFG